MERAVQLLRRDKITAERLLDDNAGIIFAVLASLTLASWGLIMRGLMNHPVVANAGVE